MRVQRVAILYPNEVCISAISCLLKMGDKYLVKAGNSLGKPYSMNEPIACLTTIKKMKSCDCMLEYWTTGYLNLREAGQVSKTLDLDNLAFVINISMDIYLPSPTHRILHQLPQPTLRNLHLSIS